jgi:hypothetical protein
MIEETVTIKLESYLQMKQEIEQLRKQVQEKTITVEKEVPTFSNYDFFRYALIAMLLATVFKLTTL